MNEHDEDEAWAEFAGASEEAKWALKEEEEEILKKHGCKFDDLPKEIKEQILDKESNWMQEHGGNGRKANEIHSRYLTTKEDFLKELRGIKSNEHGREL